MSAISEAARVYVDRLRELIPVVGLREAKRLARIAVLSAGFSPQVFAQIGDVSL